MASTKKFLLAIISTSIIIFLLSPPAESTNQPTLVFSFIQVTDTHYATFNQTSSIIDFALNNQSQFKIRYVIHSGDIAEQANSDLWEIMNNSFASLNGHVEFGWLAGNHDYDNKTSYQGDEYFAFNPNNWNLTSSLKEGRNTAQHITIDEKDYLFVNIEFYASNDVWNWFTELYNQYYDSIVILTTHSYLDPAQGIYTNDTINPSMLTDFPRIKLVLSGHRNFAYNQQVQNRQEIAFDRQYRIGFADQSDYFRLYSVYSDGTVKVLTYSNFRDSLLTDSANNFSFQLFESTTDTADTTTTPTSPPTQHTPNSSPTIPEFQSILGLIIFMIPITIAVIIKTRNKSRHA